MDKHTKEKQRYFAKWFLMALVAIVVISGVVGYFLQIKENELILFLGAEVMSLLAVFFGFNMKTKVNDD